MINNDFKQRIENKLVQFNSCLLIKDFQIIIKMKSCLLQTILGVSILIAQCLIYDNEVKLLLSSAKSFKNLNFNTQKDKDKEIIVPILPQTQYSNLYKDIYDFDVELNNTTESDF